MKRWLASFPCQVRLSRSSSLRSDKFSVRQLLPPLRTLANGYVLAVDADFRVRLYDLPLIRSITSPALFNTFSRLGSALAAQKTNVAFFSATPRGGGVALMVSPVYSLPYLPHSFFPN